MGSPEPSDGVRVVSVLLLVAVLAVPLLLLPAASLLLVLAVPLLLRRSSAALASCTGAQACTGVAGSLRKAAGCCQMTVRSHGR